MAAARWELRPADIAAVLPLVERLFGGDEARAVSAADEWAAELERVRAGGASAAGLLAAEQELRGAFRRACEVARERYSVAPDAWDDDFCPVHEWKVHVQNHMMRLIMSEPDSVCVEERSVIGDTVDTFVRAVTRSHDLAGTPFLFLAVSAVAAHVRRHTDDKGAVEEDALIRVHSALLATPATRPNKQARWFVVFAAALAVPADDFDARMDFIDSILPRHV